LILAASFDSRSKRVAQLSTMWFCSPPHLLGHSAANVALRRNKVQSSLRFTKGANLQEFLQGELLRKQPR
jgi:hypothetical protein